MAIFMARLVRHVRRFLQIAPLHLLTLIALQGGYRGAHGAAESVFPPASYGQGPGIPARRISCSGHVKGISQVVCINLDVKFASNNHTNSDNRTIATACDFKPKFLQLDHLPLPLILLANHPSQGTRIDAFLVFCPCRHNADPSRCSNNSINAMSFFCEYVGKKTVPANVSSVVTLPALACCQNDEDAPECSRGEDNHSATGAKSVGHLPDEGGSGQINPWMISSALLLVVVALLAVLCFCFYRKYRQLQRREGGGGGGRGGGGVEAGCPGESDQLRTDREES